MDAHHHMPLLLQPVYKEYVWGGDRLIHEFRRRLHPGIYAEAWEIADHPDGHTRLINGPDAGATLSEAIARRGPELLGLGRTETTFPLMVKIIDARETLSVQVHPNDETAKRVGGEAKSEMWYVLSATPDAHIYSGFRPGVTPTDFERARTAGTIPALLQLFPARPGMVFSTPGGRVHAIGAGCVLLEVQQDANTTYRLYDWDRLDMDGKPRALHVDKAERARVMALQHTVIMLATAPFGWISGLLSGVSRSLPFALTCVLLLAGIGCTLRYYGRGNERG